MATLEQLKEKYLKKQSKEDIDIIRIHHIMMKAYGWIPLEEFKKLPINTMFNLLNEIQKDQDEENKQMEEMEKKAKRR